MSAATCADCGRPMVSATVHDRQPAQRVTVAHAARGLCRTCYSRHRHGRRVAGTYPSGRSRLDDDVDEIAVERVITGCGAGITLSVRERETAVCELTRRGCSNSQTARRVGVSTRTVERIRARLRARTQQERVAA